MENSFYISQDKKDDSDMLIARQIKTTSSIKDKKPVYSKNNVYIKTNTVKCVGEVEPDDGYKFIPLIPVQKDNLPAIFVSGPAGSGKSTVCNNLVRELHKDPRFKNVEYESSEGPKKDNKAQVFLISGQKNHDTAFNAFNYKAFDIHSRDFRKITYQSFVKKILIFDDVTSLADPDLERHINGLITSLLENSRKLGNAIIVISHASQDYHKTKKIIAECSSWIVFPGLAPHQTESFLESYLGLSGEVLDEIFDLETRSLLVHRSAPQYFVSDNKILANQRKRRTKK